MIRPIDSFRRWWKNGPPPNGSEAGPAGDERGAGANGHPIDAPAAEAPWLPLLDQMNIPRSLVYPTTSLGRILDQSAER